MSPRLVTTMKLLPTHSVCAAHLRAAMGQPHSRSEAAARGGVDTGRGAACAGWPPTRLPMPGRQRPGAGRAERWGRKAERSHAVPATRVRAPDELADHLGVACDAHDASLPQVQLRLVHSRHLGTGGVKTRQAPAWRGLLTGRQATLRKGRMLLKRAQAVPAPAQPQPSRGEGTCKVGTPTWTIKNQRAHAPHERQDPSSQLPLGPDELLPSALRPGLEAVRTSRMLKVEG